MSSSSSYKDALRDQLYKIYGGPIDPDTWDPKDAERNKRIREKLERINQPRHLREAKSGEGSAVHGAEPGSEVCRNGLRSTSDVDVRPSDVFVRPSDENLRPFHQTHTSDYQTATSDYQTPTADPSSNGAYKIYLPKVDKPSIASTPGRRKLLKYLLERGSHITNYRQISEELGLKVSSLRDMFARFEKEGILSRQTIRNGEIQGMLITLSLSEEKQQTLLADITSDPDRRPPPQTVCGSPLLDRQIEKSLSVLGDKIMSWTDEQMAEWYPSLFGSGFRTAQLHQAVNDLQARCRPLDLIPVSLDYAEWELSQGKMVDKEGKAVAKPASYLFTSLKQQGHYRRPQGYVDPQEKALEEEKRRQAELQKKREALEEESYQAWLSSLSDKARETFEKERTSAQFPQPAAIFMRAKWREKQSENTVISG